MPLQSGSNSCLRRMKRTYTIEKYREIIERVRERVPNVAITTDCIVSAFAAKPKAEYEETVQRFSEQIRFDNAFLFAYSPRHSTDAFELAGRRCELKPSSVV